MRKLASEGDTLTSGSLSASESAETSADPEDVDAPAPAPAGKYKRPSARQIEANESMYEVVVDEARRSLDAQLLELSNLRTRLVQYLAFVGTATAFLVGTGIQSPDRDAKFHWLVNSAITLAVVLLVLVVLVLTPWVTPIRGQVEPKLIINRWIEREVPIAGKADMLRELALHLDKSREKNESVLTRARLGYVAAIFVGAAQLVLWSAVVAGTA